MGLPQHDGTPVVTRGRSLAPPRGLIPLARAYLLVLLLLVLPRRFLGPAVLRYLPKPPGLFLCLVGHHQADRPQVIRRVIAGEPPAIPKPTHKQVSLLPHTRLAHCQKGTRRGGKGFHFLLSLPVL